MQIDFATKLRSGALTIEEFDEFLNRRNPFGLPPFASAEVVKSNLLKYMGKLNHGWRWKFDAKNFKKDNLDGIKFSGFGSNFTTNFLRKVEENVSGGDLESA